MSFGSDWLLKNDLPNHLKNDAIIEANFETRFDADPASISEVLIGRLADFSDWRGYTQRRLPTADIPAALRRADPNLRYQPAVDLISPDGITTVRIGPQSLAYSRRAPYPGWGDYGPRAASVIDVLFAIVPAAKITRLGLRYIDALRSDVHEIAGMQSLNLSVMVNKKPLTDSLNLNYKSPVFDGSSCTVRLATRDFAQGQIPENTSVITDIDVFTDDPYMGKTAIDAKNWLTAAHLEAKERFFQLLTEDSIAKLKKD